MESPGSVLAHANLRSAHPSRVSLEGVLWAPPVHITHSTTCAVSHHTQPKQWMTKHKIIPTNLREVVFGSNT